MPEFQVQWVHSVEETGTERSFRERLLVRAVGGRASRIGCPCRVGVGPRRGLGLGRVLAGAQLDRLE